MSGVKGDFSKLRLIEQSLRELPRVLGQKVAAASAGTITRLAHATFDAGENAFGDAWAPGVHGQRVTLVRKGRLKRFSYVAIGTRLRAALGPEYAKYQVGRRAVFPRQGSRLPNAYVAALAATSRLVIAAELAGARA